MHSEANELPSSTLKIAWIAPLSHKDYPVTNVDNATNKALMYFPAVNKYLMLVVIFFDTGCPAYSSANMRQL